MQKHICEYVSNTLSVFFVYFPKSVHELFLSASCCCLVLCPEEALVLRPGGSRTMAGCERRLRLSHSLSLYDRARPNFSSSGPQWLHKRRIAAVSAAAMRCSSPAKC
ncbi:uncharacterized protein V6R79_007562 [Siganus canaliculatus]